MRSLLLPALLLLLTAAAPAEPPAEPPAERALFAGAGGALAGRAADYAVRFKNRNGSRLTRVGD